MATGALVARAAGRVAADRLRRTGTELLLRMRSGPGADVLPAPTAGAPVPASGWRAQFAIPSDLPLGAALAVAACWSLFWLPLFPQGLVPVAFKLAGADEKVWFLALHLSEPWQWPVIAAMIALGTAMLGAAIALSRRAR